MEIERVVSGDLNKSLEQCVNALIDVERKVAQLKNELVQTIQTIPNARTLPNVQGILGSSTPVVPIVAPQLGLYGNPYGSPITPFGTYGGTPWPATMAVPQQHGFAPVAGTTLAPGFASPFGAPFVVSPVPAVPQVNAPVYSHGPVGYPTLPQGFAPVQGFGYIW